MTQKKQPRSQLDPKEAARRFRAEAKHDYLTALAEMVRRMPQERKTA